MNQNGYLEIEQNSKDKIGKMLQNMFHQDQTQLSHQRHKHSVRIRLSQ
uniref:Uncharacterized protein n=1 Tax=Medicago truncatula TaxID=3880 RepID=I3T3X4_MEDTR|nr:unknown [Medicago truncatula]